MNDEEREKIAQWGWRYATAGVISLVLLLAFQAFVEKLAGQ